jgi:predicted lipoprotein
MALSSRVKNKLTDTVNTCFAKIGAVNGTKMPASGNNREPIAYELWLAHQLATLANKRKTRAEAEAVKAGIINDKEKEPKPAGTREVLFNGDVVSVQLEVRQPTTRVDHEKLVDFLVNKGVNLKWLQEAVEHASTETRPAHVFSTMLITDNMS